MLNVKFHSNLTLPDSKIHQKNTPTSTPNTPQRTPSGFAFKDHSDLKGLGGKPKSLQVNFFNAGIKPKQSKLLASSGAQAKYGQPPPAYLATGMSGASHSEKKFSTQDMNASSSLTTHHGDPVKTEELTNALSGMQTRNLTLAQAMPLYIKLANQKDLTKGQMAAKTKLGMMLQKQLQNPNVSWKDVVGNLADSPLNLASLKDLKGAIEAEPNKYGALTPAILLKVDKGIAEERSKNTFFEEGSQSEQPPPSYQATQSQQAPPSYQASQSQQAPPSYQAVQSQQSPPPYQATGTSNASHSKKSSTQNTKASSSSTISHGGQEKAEKLIFALGGMRTKSLTLAEAMPLYVELVNQKGLTQGQIKAKTKLGTMLHGLLQERIQDRRARWTHVVGDLAGTPPNLASLKKLKSAIEAEPNKYGALTPTILLNVEKGIAEKRSINAFIEKASALTSEKDYASLTKEYASLMRTLTNENSKNKVNEAMATVKEKLGKDYPKIGLNLVR
ncbi:Uncharacterized protein MCB1EB_2024 [Mycoavidus cysteinexigens]|uniref:Uncharacterized protein n=1 Tax=Mycoavidus cysteinexigens TaxID=1553431 RepID=A0A2Z6EYH1_9BURK|nr:hypothetical protein [Mycoavidus cysteinexigens]BBE10185.1 Uncharacterized protein MCB1EB_2024 [Mycoavidus cysteinexigens]GAM53456.1 hypothetical protein EBME_1919 [bacterium endosymbiont of Mortierella elongata FMR23-6]GLR00602.1 hypothetical protein GCM10007934_04130 [Mycoavidus cysteinexigens]